MSHDSKPVPFTAKRGIPIVGMPFTLEGWIVQVLIACTCDQPKPVLLIGQPGRAAGQCPSCRRVFTLNAMGFEPTTGHPQFNIGITAADEPAAGETP